MEETYELGKPLVLFSAKGNPVLGGRPIGCARRGCTAYTMDSRVTKSIVRCLNGGARATEIAIQDHAATTEG